MSLLHSNLHCVSLVRSFFHRYLRYTSNTLHIKTQTIDHSEHCACGERRQSYAIPLYSHSNSNSILFASGKTRRSVYIWPCLKPYITGICTSRRTYKIFRTVLADDFFSYSFISYLYICTSSLCVICKIFVYSGLFWFHSIDCNL